MVPLTSRVAKVYPSEALVRFGGQRGKAMADQLTTVSKLRLMSYGGALSAAEMRQVEQAIKIQLGLS